MYMHYGTLAVMHSSGHISARRQDITSILIKIITRALTLMIWALYRSTSSTDYCTLCTSKKYTLLVFLQSMCPLGRKVSGVVLCSY